MLHPAVPVLSLFLSLSLSLSLSFSLSLSLSLSIYLPLSISLPLFSLSSSFSRYHQPFCTLTHTQQVMQELEEQLRDKNQESKRLAHTVFEMRKGGAQV